MAVCEPDICGFNEIQPGLIKQFSHKSKVIIFLTSCVIYQSRLFWCELLNFGTWWQSASGTQSAKKVKHLKESDTNVSFQKSWVG